jgi:hypothetical protein
VYRNGEYLCDLELHKTGAEWEPTENHQIKPGDVLESTTDGVRLEVVSNQPAGTIRAHFKTRPL